MLSKINTYTTISEQPGPHLPQSGISEIPERSSYEVFVLLLANTKYQWRLTESQNSPILLERLVPKEGSQNMSQIRLKVSWFPRYIKKSLTHHIKGWGNVKLMKRLSTDSIIKMIEMSELLEQDFKDIVQMLFSNYFSNYFC